MTGVPVLAKILLGDSDERLLYRVSKYLAGHGFEVRTEKDGLGVMNSAAHFMPDIIICDLMLPKINGVKIAKKVKADARLQKSKVMIISSHNYAPNIKQCFINGATDYVLKPFAPEDLLSRIIYQLQEKKEMDTADKSLDKQDSAAGKYLDYLVKAVSELTSNKTDLEMMHNITCYIAESVEAVRCSITMSDMNQSTARILASHDDKDIYGLSIKLVKYPEVVHVLNSGKIVVIDNMDKDPVMKNIKKSIKSVSFNSMMILPILYRGVVLGVLSIRLGEKSKRISNAQIRFAQIIAASCGNLVGNRFKVINAARKKAVEKDNPEVETVMKPESRN